ncbi:polyphosphate kinase [Burkholderiales bacterium]|nr:MAG: polyphosphate kinase 1 [Burkholderiales bacterium]CAG1003178.1 polyphosphate kinase [Burkholderiales bacterium]
MDSAVQAKSVPASSELYLNRELSQLAFNWRVLEQARDPAVPLLERLRFVCILGSNLDEFVEIRMAGLRAQAFGEAGAGARSEGSRKLFAQVALATHQLVAAQYQTLNEDILPQLAAQGIRFLHHVERNERQRAWVADYFFREVKPLLTPIGLDPAHPFPQVFNKSLNFVVELSGRDAFGRDTSVAIVKAPRVLPRVIKLPPELGEVDLPFVLLSSVIRAHISDLFGGREVLAYSQFRVTRNSDLWLDEEEVKNLRQALSGELPQRHLGQAVRLEILADCPESLAQFLLTQFELEPMDLYRVNGPVNMVRLSEVIDQIDRPDLKYPRHLPGLPERLRGEPDMFTAIRRADVLLHHPYQSFDPVVDFLRQAAEDPRVVAIKQTVYRTGTHSVVMDALLEATRRGKEVTVVLELMARFDEEANINWAERLEQVGVQVVYGVVGLKTHAKLALVVRREEGGLRSYAHLGTGNYHPSTARLYTDFGLFTARREICNEVGEVFLHLTSLARVERLRRLWLAPFTLARRLIRAIHQEAQHARAGRPARIVARMNALLDEGVIGALYAASQAGVKIELIVRGACALRPGVPGLSDNISVRSIIGRLLEHSRVYYFFNDGAEDVYLASADWMGRNLHRRIEVAFPVLDAELKRRVIAEGLETYLADNRQTWVLEADGKYRRIKPRSARTASSAQDQLLRLMSARPEEA